ncbi:hypothetical protein [Actinospica robiniae]|uniref:hypothetical protein n=1 Tax=Actinospica robiniae TaxID=304901 RepID=UPI0012FB6910|nr:hypothetical protein [Actinospica robiniae]
MRRIQGRALLGVVLTGALAACSGTPTTPAAEKKAAPTRSTPTLSPSKATDPAAQAALTAYREMWADFAAVADSGNYREARLGDHMTGKLYLDSSQNLFVTEQRGMVGKGEPRLLRPTVVSENLTAHPAVVTVTDCVDGRGFLFYYAATGKLVDDVPGGLQGDTTQMTLVGTTWKGAEEQLGPEGSCTA